MKKNNIFSVHQVIRILVFSLMPLIYGCSQQNIPREELRDIVLKNDDNRRYALVNDPMTVIDTHTGQVWKVERTTKGNYQFERICYLASDGKSLMPTPYEEEFVKDLTRYQKECKAK